MAEEKTTTEKDTIIVGGKEIVMGKDAVPITPKKEITAQEFIDLLKEASEKKLWPDFEGNEDYPD